MDSLAKGWWQHIDSNVEISSKNAGIEVVSSFKPRKFKRSRKIEIATTKIINKMVKSLKLMGGFLWFGLNCCRV